MVSNVAAAFRMGFKNTCHYTEEMQAKFYSEEMSGEPGFDE